MRDATQQVRHHQAVLVGVLARHDHIPRAVTSQISAAADELLDPTELPELLHSADLELRDPKTAVNSAIEALRILLPHLDASTALACGRAVAHLVEAQQLWGQP